MTSTNAGPRTHADPTSVLRIVRAQRRQPEQGSARVRGCPNARLICHHETCEFIRRQPVTPDSRQYWWPWKDQGQRYVMRTGGCATPLTVVLRRRAR